jgi:hypothetical protein
MRGCVLDTLVLLSEFKNLKDLTIIACNMGPGSVRALAEGVLKECRSVQQHNCDLFDGDVALTVTHCCGCGFGYGYRHGCFTAAFTVMAMVLVMVVPA